MNELKVFESNLFGEVRTVEENGKVLFCGSDVAKALGYARPQNAVENHCRYALKKGVPLFSDSELPLVKSIIDKLDLS